MSKRDKVQETDADYNVVELEETNDLDIQDSDVGFLLDKDGNLKSVFGPAEGFENPSEAVAAILEIFGIDEFTAPNRTLH
jgi:hypothetical protein